MLYVRSVIYFILLVVTTILFSFLLLFPGIFLPYDRRCKIANYWGRTNMTFLKLICGLDYKLSGAENLELGNCIIMSKHQSAWETISLRGILPPNQVWVLKKELMSVPVFGWALRLCQPIAIDRKSGRKAVTQVIKQGKEALDGGRWVIVFPEGTRVQPGTRKKYGIGGALLAEKSSYPVIPVAHNAGRFWKRRDLRKYPGTINVVIGTPIPSKDKKASQIIAEVEDWIETKMKSIDD